jgi:hypothetical protein
MRAALLSVLMLMAGCSDAPEELGEATEEITGLGGICWGDNPWDTEPGCHQYPVPANLCGESSSCNDCPNACCGRCNYGYVCTSGCYGANPTVKSSHHKSCSAPAYLPIVLADGVTEITHNPGADLKCGTADDIQCTSDGKNPGKDGRCNDATTPPGENWDADNYPQ